ncbi:MAG TPA: hypothetical protein VN045_00650 [Microbacteriaceae bacterium]|uniref:hypothetical protein n=1 Tax=Microbacterium sp. 22195 TaxID=3453891 RepID=UPI002D184547|nr:hypothetical protein [Microbacteriaceae bacterium]
MRQVGWVILVIVAGLGGATITLLELAGAVPATWYIVPIAVVPLLCFWAAFFGLMLSDSISSSLIVGLSALLFPVPDIWIHSELAGNFDDARGQGLVTGLALAAAGVIAFVIISKKNTTARASATLATA